MYKKLWLLAIAVLCLSWAGIVLGFNGNGPSGGTLTLSVTPNVITYAPTNSVSLSLALAGENCGATHTDPLDHKITVTGNGRTVGNFTVLYSARWRAYTGCTDSYFNAKDIGRTRNYYCW